MQVCVIPPVIQRERGYNTAHTTDEDEEEEVEVEAQSQTTTTLLERKRIKACFFCTQCLTKYNLCKLDIILRYQFEPNTQYCKQI